MSENGKIWKVVVGAGVLIGITLGIIEYDDRLAKSDELELIKETQKEQLVQLETKVVQSMQQFQKNQDLRHYDYLDDMLEKENFKCRNILITDPDNQEAQRNCAEIESKRFEIREKKRELCQ